MVIFFSKIPLHTEPVPTRKYTSKFSMIKNIIDPCETKTLQAPCIISDSLYVGKINPLAWAYENKTIIFPSFLSVRQQYNNFCRQHANVVVVVVVVLPTPTL